MNEIEITLTDDDIDWGRRHGELCPITLAAERVIDGSISTERTRLRRIYTDHESGERTIAEYELPDEAMLFIKMYDEGEEVEPFGFFISNPDEILWKDFITNKLEG